MMNNNNYYNKSFSWYMYNMMRALLRNAVPIKIIRIIRITLHSNIIWKSYEVINVYIVII